MAVNLTEKVQSRYQIMGPLFYGYFQRKDSREWLSKLTVHGEILNPCGPKDIKEQMGVEKSKIFKSRPNIDWSK